jgi:hypothetical protein
MGKYKTLIPKTQDNLRSVNLLIMIQRLPLNKQMGRYQLNSPVVIPLNLIPAAAGMGIGMNPPHFSDPLQIVSLPLCQRRR